jgi:DNA-binding response OmpR family regulator
MRRAWERCGAPNPLIIVKDGQEAIDYLAGRGRFADRQRHPLPCLLLLDVKLPVKSGFEVLRWLRGLKAVVVSGSDQERDIAAARSLGVIDFVTKPVGHRRLVELLRKKKDVWLAG